MTNVFTGGILTNVSELYLCFFTAHRILTIPPHNSYGLHKLKKNNTAKYSTSVEKRRELEE